MYRTFNFHDTKDNDFTFAWPRIAQGILRVTIRQNLHWVSLLQLEIELKQREIVVTDVKLREDPIFANFKLHPRTFRITWFEMNM